MRTLYEARLEELQRLILDMGVMVEDELKLALKALRKKNARLAQRAVESDADINARRFQIEEMCYELIVTQQPAARDLRVVVAALNIIVDLERMGDKAKGIGRLVPQLENTKAEAPPQIDEMSELALTMLKQSMSAYQDNNIELAELVGQHDETLDHLYDQVMAHVIEQMAATKKQHKIETSYEFLQVAQELERFGDQATNIAERVIYIATGNFQEFDNPAE